MLKGEIDAEFGEMPKGKEEEELMGKATKNDGTFGNQRIWLEKK